MKKLRNLKNAKPLSKGEQREVNGGLKKFVCQGGGDPECCGYGAGQCGVGHCSGGILVGGVCACF